MLIGAMILIYGGNKETNNFHKSEHSRLERLNEPPSMLLLRELA